MKLGTRVRRPYSAPRVRRLMHEDLDRVMQHDLSDFADFDRLVNELWSGFGLAPVAFAPAGQREVAFRPGFDAVGLEKEYRVSADLPGVDPADLEVTVEDGVLHVKGRRRFEEVVEQDAAQESEPGRVSRIDERGRFERRFRFPSDIVENEVKATFRNGVLTVKIPKHEAAAAEVRTIPVETA